MKQTMETDVNLIATPAITVPKGGRQGLHENRGAHRAERVGAAARALGFIKAEVAMGIPISISGKSIFYDRKTPLKSSLAKNRSN